MEIKRYNENPILTAADVPFKVNSIFNAGAIKFNGQYLLLCRIELPTGLSSLILARSEDGYHFTVDEKPILTPDIHGEFFEYANWGVEDARITEIDGVYYITYTGYSVNEPVVLLARTKNFKDFELLGPISEPVNKDAVIFPEKIDGYYWKIDRPAVSALQGDMWINRSPDLLHWGMHRRLIAARKPLWDGHKIGASTPPIKTEKGWLMLYHGVRMIGTSMIYRQGVLLLDAEKPFKVIGRSLHPILSPEEEYERMGDVPNVIFSTGWIPEPGGEIKIYYSGADSNVSLAITSVDYLLSQCNAGTETRS
ncbi:MAG: glycosidase [Calditrichaeota bacterium]|nr:glycosidase [Calditrichota bacterium]